MTGLKVLSVASEIFPLIKTGGLADVVGALPAALGEEGVEVRTLVPGYPAVLQALESAQQLTSFRGLRGGTARLLAATAHGLKLFVLDAPQYFKRPGNPYVGPDGKEWPDNAMRFAALAKVAAEIGLGALPSYKPDIVHMHDWQAALAAAYIYYSGAAQKPGTVLTVHNLAFPGQFPAKLLKPLGLPESSFAWDGVEHYGFVGFLKAGLQLSGRITTVSPSYAVEITQKETGMGFDGLLRVRRDRLSGILNGIDTTVWNPATDPLIAARYDAVHIGVRGINKAALQEAFGLHRDFGALLIGVVSRLSEQKGLDLLLDVVQGIVDHGMQLALLGAGDAELEAEFEAAAKRYPGRIGVRLGYNETLAHRIQAGSDIILVPSRFEPCGLTQICGLRYGAVPLVARAGGLNDTVIDANEMALAAGAATGIQFFPITAENLWIALEKAARLYRDPARWRTMQKNGMTADYSWHQAARQYAKLYRELLGVPASPVEYKEQARETAQPDEVAGRGAAAEPGTASAVFAASQMDEDAGKESPPAGGQAATAREEPPSAASSGETSAAAMSDEKVEIAEAPGAAVPAELQKDGTCNERMPTDAETAAMQDHEAGAALVGHAPGAAESGEMAEAGKPSAAEVQAAVQMDEGCSGEEEPADAGTAPAQNYVPHAAPAGKVLAAATGDEGEEAGEPRAAEVPAPVQMDEVSCSAGPPSDLETAAMQDHAGSVELPAREIAGAGTGDEEADSTGPDAGEVPPVVQMDEVSFGAGPPSDLAGSVDVPACEIAGAGTGDEEADSAGPDAGEVSAAVQEDTDASVEDLSTREKATAAPVNGDSGRGLRTGQEQAEVRNYAASVSAPAVPAAGKGDWEGGFVKPSVRDAPATGHGATDTDARGVRAGEKLHAEVQSGKAPGAGPRSADAPAANGDKAVAAEPRREPPRRVGNGKAGNGAGAA